jgi:hypothetical protein
MLSSSVYRESHPRRSAAFASRMHLRDVARPASCTSSISYNSFTSFSFRKLSSHFQTLCSSIPFAFNHFRTLCQIPGIGYPPPSILFPTLLPRVRSVSAEIALFCALTPLVVTLAHFMGGGGVSPNRIFPFHNVDPAGQTLAFHGSRAADHESRITGHDSSASLPRHFVSATVTAAGGFFYVSQ